MILRDGLCLATRQIIVIRCRFKWSIVWLLNGQRPASEVFDSKKRNLIQTALGRMRELWSDHLFSALFIDSLLLLAFKFE